MAGNTGSSKWQATNLSRSTKARSRRKSTPTVEKWHPGMDTPF